jgi:hypothetical protein
LQPLLSRYTYKIPVKEPLLRGRLFGTIKH